MAIYVVLVNLTDQAMRDQGGAGQCPDDHPRGLHGGRILGYFKLIPRPAACAVHLKIAAPGEFP